MPVIGLKVLCLSPSLLGLLFTSMGAGSVVAALAIIPWLRARYAANSVTVLANLLVLLVYLLMAPARQRELFFFIAALAGVGWTVSASELWVAAQRAMPNWARGRMNAAVIMVSQGAMALGGVIWGSVVAAAGVNCALVAAAVPLLLSLVLAARLSINFTRTLNFDPAPVTNLSQSFGRAPPPDHGPVAVALEFKIDFSRRREFLSLMQEIRRLHLRNGAHEWGFSSRNEGFILE
jgi:hypothetical protein